MHVEATTSNKVRLWDLWPVNTLMIDLVQRICYTINSLLFVTAQTAFCHCTL